ncbi:MAG: hypothetical protein KDD95_16980 [Rhodobacteraceae bacterium]|nr:hypothetical protein [Paracoccaceae bacterium]MCB2132370.1 hypothetical protein [Paracoccaceae bacterium]MCB2138077.1 hypothetical protein [Paracoccaceae bacterium]MCB2159957.1 hypothetical protein [Paracoccaceae bacterium]
MTDKAEKKPRAPRKPKAPKPDAAKLRALAAEIDAKLNQHQNDLVHRLEAEEGAKIADDGPALGWSVTLAGIRATGTAGVRGALSNWANAARRAALKAEAA